MTEIALDDLWVRRFHPGPDRDPVLVCFPHAGGSASYFRPLSAALQRTRQTLVVQYPGRQDRMHEPGPATIGEFADRAFDALRPVCDRPLALFGHSMGALIAFEVATRMRQELDREPEVLFVSSRQGPDRYRDERLHLLPDSDLIVRIRGMSGTDDRILDDEAVARMVLAPMRNDYAALSVYRYRPGPTLSCPIVALVGVDDDAVEMAEVQGWAERTTGSFSLRSFPGGHFYLVEQQAAVVELITAATGP